MCINVSTFVQSIICLSLSSLCVLNKDTGSISSVVDFIFQLSTPDTAACSNTCVSRAVAIFTQPLHVSLSIFTVCI